MLGELSPERVTLSLRHTERLRLCAPLYSASTSTTSPPAPQTSGEGRRFFLQLLSRLPIMPLLLGCAAAGLFTRTAAQPARLRVRSNLPLHFAHARHPVAAPNFVQDRAVAMLPLEMPPAVAERLHAADAALLPVAAAGESADRRFPRPGRRRAAPWAAFGGVCREDRVEGLSHVHV